MHTRSYTHGISHTHTVIHIRYINLHIYMYIRSTRMVMARVYIRYFWQGNHQKYGHVRGIYTILLAGKSPKVRTCTGYIYSPGQL